MPSESRQRPTAPIAPAGPPGGFRGGRGNRRGGYYQPAPPRGGYRGGKPHMDNLDMNAGGEPPAYDEKPQRPMGRGGRGGHPSQGGYMNYGHPRHMQPQMRFQPPQNTYRQGNMVDDYRVGQYHPFAVPFYPTRPNQYPKRVFKGRGRLSSQGQEGVLPPEVSSESEDNVQLDQRGGGGYHRYYGNHQNGRPQRFPRKDGRQPRSKGYGDADHGAMPLNSEGWTPVATCE